jgi:hypothetical protein
MDRRAQLVVRVQAGPHLSRFRVALLLVRDRGETKDLGDRRPSDGPKPHEKGEELDGTQRVQVGSTYNVPMRALPAWHPPGLGQSSSAWLAGEVGAGGAGAGGTVPALHVPAPHVPAPQVPAPPAPQVPAPAPPSGGHTAASSAAAGPAAPAPGQEQQERMPRHLEERLRLLETRVDALTEALAEMRASHNAGSQPADHAPWPSWENVHRHGN